MVVVDASVAVKWFLEEEYADEAIAIRDAYVDGAIELVAPSLLPYEVVNALRYSGQFDDGLETASVALSKYGIELVSFEGIDGVSDVSVQTDCTIYDAAYVALAETRSEALYTTDERLLDQVESYTDQAEHVVTFG